METSVRATTHHQRVRNASDLIRPGMRQRLRGLKNELDYYLRDIKRYCDHLSNIRDATFIARQSARCLLEFEAFHGLRKKQNTSKTGSANAKVEKLFTAQMRQQISEAIKTADDYATCLERFIGDVYRLKSFEVALKFAEDLQCDQPLETPQPRKRREEEAAEEEGYFDLDLE